MNKRLLFILLMLLPLSFIARASHIVGGEFTYKFLGDTTVGSSFLQKYQVSLSIYEDCINGNPDAIAQDNPAYFGLFTPLGAPLGLDTNVFYSVDISVPANFSNACVSNIPATCLLKKTFTKIYYLPPSTEGYLISYQRCCRNAAIINISDPGANGSTYYCVIPPTSTVLSNNSAVFTNYPPQVICLNNPLYYDNSATDADGDSLSYGFVSAINGANDPSNSKPFPGGPPYGNVSYISPFSATYPIASYPAIHIDPVTGIITGTPNALGRYLVTVYCNEYRHGVLINTIRREFQFVVTPCTKVVVADIPQYSTDPNTYVVDCSNYTINFVNTSTGGFDYHWDFGVAGATNDTSNEFEPTFTYPDTGTYTVKLVVNPHSTCPDSITRFVKVYPYFHANFTDSGAQCPGVPISFKDLSTASIKPVNYWKWNFGDGDSSFVENPTHTYAYGGIYNVVFVSQNVKDCSDTILKQVLVDNFSPFAGNDTTIVKGESILFDATGGTNYAWTPGTNLNSTDVYDPLGNYPDTGTFTYYVYVTTELGCSGYDTIKVTVVNQAEFFVPTGFTPNGDGKNDYFRPVAVGYRALNYLRVFNRWGQIVYNGNVLDSGWDGTFNGKKVEEGTYFWEMSFTDRFGKESTLKGDVTLIR
jgi:gliding motility-associated-like protein